jgi:Ca-activated chloride channel family protein
MSFAAPSVLFSLFALPVAAFGLWLLDRRRASRASGWARPAMLPNSVRRPRRGAFVPVLLLLLALASLLVGLARPQRVLGATTSQPPTVVLAFDTSGSMAATDSAPTRLGVARRIATEFLDEMPPRFRVAVVTFAQGVHLAVAPTLDRRAAIAGIPRSVTPLGGTALGDGIAYSVALAASGTHEANPGAVFRPGAVLLFSDGVQTSAGASPVQATVSAVVDYVPVSAVAIGTREGVVSQPIQIAGVHTTRTLAVPAAPAVLRTIARQTSGSFFDTATARPPGDLRKVYEHLHSFSTADRRTHSLAAGAAALAFVFLLGGMALSGYWYGRPA